jgi:PAS domain S-box-containing protein
MQGLIQGLLERINTSSLRQRIYAASAFFFVLICALVATAIYSFKQQETYHNRLNVFSNSAVNIERANGLIYAIVMESRGIYMSSDPVLVKRYGDALLNRNRELAAVVEEWEQLVRDDDAELFVAFKARIQQFISFRAELVRRANAIGQMAGREWGDNEANRSARSALNADLEALGRVYAKRSAQILELNQQARLITWLLALLGLGAMALAAYVGMLIQTSVIAPLHDITATTDRIAAGRVVASVPHSERHDEIGRLGQAVQQLQDTLVRNKELVSLERTTSRQRDNLEIQLQENKRHLLAAINSMVPGLIMLDLEGKVILMNEAYRKIYRLPPDLPQSGLTIRDVVQFRVNAGTFSGDIESYVASMLARIEQGKPGVSHAELRDGKVIRIIERAMSGGTGWVATHEDYTEQRHLQRSLERTEQMLAAIIENIHEAIVAKDAASLRYVFVNRAAETLFGIKRSAMLGKTAREVFGLDAAEWIEQGDRALLQPGSAPTTELRTIETPGNGKRLVAIRRLPLAGESADARFLLSMIEDRTEQPAPAMQLAAG